MKHSTSESYSITRCASKTVKPILTNEEWFCQLSTEEKAKWITENLSVYADSCVKNDEKLLNPATWVDWLNEVHK